MLVYHNKQEISNRRCWKIMSKKTATVSIIIQIAKFLKLMCFSTSNLHFCNTEVKSIVFQVLAVLFTVISKLSMSNKCMTAQPLSFFMTNNLISTMVRYNVSIWNSFYNMLLVFKLVKQLNCYVTTEWPLEKCVITALQDVDIQRHMRSFATSIPISICKYTNTHSIPLEMGIKWGREPTSAAHFKLLEISHCETYWWKTYWLL